MTEKRYLLAEKLRTYISKYGINDFNEEHLKTVGVTLEELKENFSDRRDIVKAILEHERNCFAEIFEEYDFNGWNAIDIMLITAMKSTTVFSMSVLPSPSCYPKISRTSSSPIRKSVQFHLRKNQDQH